MSGSPPPIYTVSDSWMDAPPPSYESVIGSITPKTNQPGTVPPTPSAPSASNQPSHSRTSSTPQSSPPASTRPALCADFSKAPSEARFNVVSCAIFTILDIIALIIGAIYFKQCNVNDGTVPTFLVVYGISAGIFHSMTGLEEYVFTVKKGMSKEEREKKKPGPIKLFHFLLAMFGFGYFIYGCVIIIGNFGNWVQSPTTDDDYCHPVMFQYAFFMIVFSLSFLAFIIFCGCIMAWGKWMCGKE